MNAFALLAEIADDPHRVKATSILTSVQRAKDAVGRRLGRDLMHTRLIEMPADLRTAVKLLAREYRSLAA